MPGGGSASHTGSEESSQSRNRKIVSRRSKNADVLEKNDELWLVSWLVVWLVGKGICDTPWRRPGWCATAVRLAGGPHPGVDRWESPMNVGAPGLAFETWEGTRRAGRQGFEHVD